MRDELTPGHEDVSEIGGKRARRFLDERVADHAPTFEIGAV